MIRELVCCLPTTWGCTTGSTTFGTGILNLVIAQNIQDLQTADYGGYHLFSTNLGNLECSQQAKPCHTSPRSRTNMLLWYNKTRCAHKILGDKDGRARASEAYDWHKRTGGGHVKKWQAKETRCQLLGSSKIKGPAPHVVEGRGNHNSPRQEKKEKGQVGFALFSPIFSENEQFFLLVRMLLRSSVLPIKLWPFQVSTLDIPLFPCLSAWPQSPKSGLFR